MKAAGKGGVAALLIGKMGKEKDDASMEDDSDESSEALNDASSRMMSAVGSKDSSAFTSALKDFIAICNETPEEPTDDEDDY